MEKQLCELCRQYRQSDMRFGVRLCKECIEGLSKVAAGDAEALARYSDPQNFPDATDGAYNGIIVMAAKRAQRLLQTRQAAHTGTDETQKSGAAGVKEQPVIQPRTVTSQVGSVDSLYNNIGSKIKNWAKWVFIVEAVASVIGAIVMMAAAESAGAIATGLLALVVGPVIAWVSSWLLYGFGELIEKTSANEQHTRQILQILSEKKQ